MKIVLGAIVLGFVLIMFLVTLAEADEPHDWYGNPLDDDEDEQS